MNRAALDDYHVTASCVIEKSHGVEEAANYLESSEAEMGNPKALVRLFRLLFLCGRRGDLTGIGKSGDSRSKCGRVVGGSRGRVARRKDFIKAIDAYERYMAVFPEEMGMFVKIHGDAYLGAGQREAASMAYRAAGRKDGSEGRKRTDEELGVKDHEKDG